MTVFVIDRFEVIDIDHHQPDRPLVTSGAGNLIDDGFLEITMIIETG